MSMEGFLDVAAESLHRRSELPQSLVRAGEEPSNSQPRNAHKAYLRNSKDLVAFLVMRSNKADDYGLVSLRCRQFPRLVHRHPRHQHSGIGAS